MNPASDASDPARRAERQRAGLVRVRLDGVLLACNDAALGLLGGSARPEVLNTNLTDRVVPAERPQWQAFRSRCWAEGAAVLECEFLLHDNTARRLLVEGVALAQHPDGFESLLLHLREPQTDQAPRAAATDERRDGTFAALEKKLEYSQLAALQKEREYGRDVAMLKAALAAAHAAKATALAEQARLQAVVTESEAERERVAADSRATVDAVQQSLADAVAEQSRIAARAEEQTRELDRLRTEHHGALAHLETAAGVVADLRRQLSEAAAEHDRLAMQVEEHERERERLQARVAEHDAGRAGAAADHRAAVSALEQSLAQALAERQRIAAGAEEQTREHDVMRAAHQRALADLEAARDAALDELRSQQADALDMLQSQLAESLAEQRRLAAHADEQTLELDRLRAEHTAALTDLETRGRDLLAQVRAELAETAAEHTRVLIERAEQHERERDRMRAAHDLAISDLQASNEAATAELRSTLSAALAEQQRLTALLEEQDRERERVAAEHRRAIAELQASKQEVERRLVEGLVESPQVEVDGQRLAFLQRGLTQSLSRVHSVLTDDATTKESVEAEPDADLLREPFDDADDAFVHQLLGDVSGSRSADAQTVPPPLASAQAAPATPAATGGGESADAVFDAQDAAFASRLMSTHRAPEESDDAADAQPPQALANPQPTAPEES